MNYNNNNNNNNEYYIDNLVEELAKWIDSTYWDWVYDIDEWTRNDC
jgi:hypothetical protein